MCRLGELVGRALRR